MKKKVQLPKFDFFPDFMALFDSDMFITAASITSDEESEVENETDYLAREERILTLARKKFKKALGSFSLAYWEERLYAEIPEKGELLGDVVKRISRVVTRPLLREMQSFTDNAAQTLLKLVELPNIKVSFHDVSCVPERLFNQFKGSFKNSKNLSEKDFLVLIFEEEGKAPVTILGAKDLVHSGKFKNCYYLNFASQYIVDLADFFAYLTVYVQVMKEVVKIRNGEESLYEGSFRQCIDEFRVKFIKNNVYLRVPPSYMVNATEGERATAAKEEFFKEDAWQKLLSTPINKGMWDDVDGDLIQFLESQRIPVSELTGTKIYEEFGNGELERIVHLNSESDWLTFYSCFMLETNVPYRTFCCRWRDSKRGYSCMPLSKKVRGFVCEDKRVSLLADLFYFIAKEKYQLSQMAKHYRELDGEYAKSFMSKKLDVQKVKDAMEKSTFNEYFGFVEFDEETKLNEVEEVAKEFKAVKDTYLKGVDSKENVIRFRKLGQHKALGLYYPGVSCLCVDIRSPESLTHEYGHLIDYTYGNLSITAAFKKVRDAYEEEFNSYLNGLSDDSGMKKVLKGKTKYNKDYYLKATEVFARSFELYISVCLGVRNSIVPLPEALADGIYPQSESYLSQIKAYFDALFERLNGEDEGNCKQSVVGNKAASN